MSTDVQADAPSAEPSESETVEPVSAPPLRLSEVDRCLSPLRRVVNYAGRAPAEVRFLEATCTPWVERLLALSLPDSVALDAAELLRQLIGVDALEDDARLSRIGELTALIARLDAILGLPLDDLRLRRSRRRVYPRRQREEQKPAADDSDESATAAPDDEVSEPSAAEDDVTDERSEDASADKAEERSGSRRRRRRDYSVPKDTPSAPRREPRLPKGPWRLGEGIGGIELSKRNLPAEWVELLASADIQTSTDLFRTKPTGYETFRPLHGAGMAIEPGHAAVGGRVRSRFTALSPSGERTTRVLVRGAGHALLDWGRELHEGLLDGLVPGERVAAVGQLSQPEGAMQRLDDVELTATHGSKVAHLATYGLDGVPDRIVRAVFRLVRGDLDNLRDPLSDSVRKAHGLLSLGEAFAAVHGADANRKAGHKRLAFEEGVYAQLGLALQESSAPAQRRGIAHPVMHQLVTRLTTWRDVEVDDDHLAAFEIIKRDLRQPRPMLRLLAGRPGDQRERVALLAAVTVAESKSQVLWLLPDRVMAEALFCLYEPMLREVGLVARLLDDEPSRSVRDALRRGEVHVVFGTLALAKADLQLRRLGLVIAEESEPGAVDRSTFAGDSAPVPDVLIVPTRPIGAGHLLGPYAEHAVSWVRPTRWPRFHTVLVPASQRDEAYQHVLESINDGAQALIALPVGKHGDLLEPEEAVRVRTTLEDHLPGARIQLFHGALSREERNRRYEDFQRRRFEVLLATHAVEHGPVVPGATELVVEQADRMPRERLSRLLHRLVGLQQPTVRLIHGDKPDPAGLEILDKLKRGRIDDALTPESVETSEPRLSWIRPARNVDLLLAARKVALETLAADPSLQRGQNTELARSLALWWPDLFTADCPVQVEKKANAGSGRRRRRRRRRR